MFQGGFLKGELYPQKDPGVEVWDCLVYGTVCKDAKTFRYKTKKAKNSMKVDVLIKYDDGEGGYVSIWAFKDTYISRSLSLLKKNDKAVIFGKLIRKTRYVEGEELPIVHAYIDPAFVIPHKLIETIDILVASKKFQSMIAEEFESGEDFWDEREKEQEERKAEYERWKAEQAKKRSNEDEDGFDGFA